MALESINPATGVLIGRHAEMSSTEVHTIVARAARAQTEWARTSFAVRAEVLHAVAKNLLARKDALAELAAAEMGKPLNQGLGEVDKCASACRFFADHAERFLTPELVKTDARSSYVAFAPLGVVLAVMPWNFPYWQVFRFLAPALMAGNAAVLKHASNVQGCALAIEELFAGTGLPRELFRVLVIGSDKVADVVRRDEVRAVTLTGSTPAGKAIAETAGSVLKKAVLELGGSDPYIVLADADLDHAAATCATSRLINTGQSCIAAKRFIVVEAVRDEFTERFVAILRTKTWGDPLAKKDVDLGPLARVDLRDALHDQVTRSIQSGARLLLGGEIPPGPGAFYPPTALDGVRRGMAVYSEETFGPVAAIIAAKDEDEAVEIANDTDFGLGAAVFTRDLARGEAIARDRLRAGSCFVNDLVRSDARLPFGGIGASGYGRELSAFGIREFVNVKTVWVA